MSPFFRRIIGLLSVSAMLASALPAAAQTNYAWNIGDGTWANGSGGWVDPGSAPVNWNNSLSLNATFGGPGGTVNVDAAGVTVYGFFFTSSYTLNNGTITLADPGNVGGTVGSAVVNADSAINSSIGGSVGLLKQGSATLILGGNNVYSGTTSVSAGMLQLTNSAALGSSSVLLNTGGVLAINHNGTTPNAMTVTGSAPEIYTFGVTPTLTGSISSDGLAGTLNLTSNRGADGSHNLTFSDNSISLGAKALNVTGITVDNEGDSDNSKTTLNNVTLTTSSDVRVGRGSLQIQGTTSLTIGGQLQSGVNGDWARFIMGPGTSVTASAGVNMTANNVIASSLYLNGGTLTTPFIIGNSFVGQTHTIFNGVTVIATTDNPDFLQVRANGSGDFHSGAGELANSGLTMNTNGFNIGIQIVLADLPGFSAGLTKTGAGTLTLSAANSYSGGTTVNAGTLQLAATGTLGANNNSLHVNNGAVLNLGGTTQVVGQTNDGGGGGAVGTITNGTLNLNGNNFFFRSGTMDADLTGGGGSRIWLGGDPAATINLGGNNTVDFGDHHSMIIGHPVTGDVGIVRLTSSTALGPDNVGGNTIEAQLFTGTIDLNGQVGVTVGNLVLSNGGGSNLVNNAATTTATMLGTVRVDNGGTVIGGAGNITLTNVIFGGGGFNKTGAGTLNLTAANTYTGVTIFTGGIVNVATLTDYGTPGGLGNRAGDSGGEDMGLLFRGGTLQYTGSTPQSTNRALRVSTDGGGTIDASGSNPSATLSFTAATTPNFWENPGTRNFTLTGTNTGANTFATVIPDIPGVTVSNVIKSGSGTWILSGANTYLGSTAVNGGILRLAGAGTLGNPGQPVSVNNGATLDLGGTTQTIGQMNNSGSGSGAVGIITNGSLNLNGSNFFFQSGTLDANLAGSGGSRLWLGGDAAATIILGGNNTVDFSDHHSTIIGFPVTGDAGIVRLVSATALGPNNVAGNTVEAQLFTGTIDANGQAGITVGNLRLASGASTRLVNSNTGAAASFSGTIQVDGTNTEFGGSGAMNFNAAINGGGGINKTGTGTITLNAVNSYGGGTRITAGRVQLGIANALPNNGTLTLAGGTLRSGATAGFSNTLGTLNIEGTGTIELGTGSHTLTFAALDPTNFTSLSIAGWTGTFGATGTAGHIVFTDASGLSASVLASIQFTGYGPGALLISGNEIVPFAPIPEPTALIFVALAGLPLLRRYKLGRFSFDHS